MAYKDLGKDEQFVYDWQHGILGSFSDSLAELICKADIKNKAKLSEVYPVEVRGIINFQQTAGWWNNILNKVKIKIVML